jgi:hypothetical protein
MSSVVFVRSSGYGVKRERGGFWMPGGSDEEHGVVDHCRSSGGTAVVAGSNCDTPSRGYFHRRRRQPARAEHRSNRRGRDHPRVQSSNRRPVLPGEAGDPGGNGGVPPTSDRSGKRSPRPSGHFPGRSGRTVVHRLRRAVGRTRHHPGLPRWHIPSGQPGDQSRNGLLCSAGPR